MMKRSQNVQSREQKLVYLKKTIETLWHGVSDTKEGDYPRIISLYKEVLMHDYHDADSWENMIWLMWSMAINKKDTVWLFQAEKFAKRYLSLNPNGYRAYEYLGQFYRIMYVDLRLAIRYYESAIRWKDAPSSTHHSLISVCDKAGDRVKAIGYCKMTLARFPNDPYTKSKLEVLTKLQAWSSSFLSINKIARPNESNVPTIPINAILSPPMKEIITAIYQNGKFKDNKILKPHLTDRIGIRMTFPEGAECILWTNGKKYYAVCEAFGTIFTVSIPRNLGDDIWDRFKTEFEGNYSYNSF